MEINSPLQQDREKDWPCALKVTWRQNVDARHHKELKIKRSPIGNFENMQWDKQALLEEVNSYADGTVINWSALARQYQVKNKNGQLAKNGRQIVQEYLKSQGVDVSKFKKRGLQEDEGSRIRKKMKRSAGGEITVPCPVTNENLKEKLNQKILSGEYNVGELIGEVCLAQLCHIITRHIY